MLHVGYGFLWFTSDCDFLLQRLMYQPAALATKVLCLTQIVNVDDLKDGEVYEEIVEDMRTEGGRFGKFSG